MLKHILKEAAQRLVADTARLGRGLLPPIDAARTAHAAVRALSRNWTAATALAEVTAARWSARPPDAEPPSGPFRILFVARFGALHPHAELAATALLDALEAAIDLPRARPVSLSLCATRAVAAPGSPDLDASSRLFRHTVLDATEVAASDVAAWVAAHDLVLTSTDFGPDAAPADVELAAMALGFARARGLPAIAANVVSPPASMGPDVLAFLNRFAKKARYATIRHDTAHALEAAGFVTVAPPALTLTRTAATATRSDGPEGQGGHGPVFLIAPCLPDANPAPSPLSELVGLGQLLFGRATTREHPAASPAATADLLAAHGIGLTRVALGRGAPPWPLQSPPTATGIIHLDDAASLDTWCSNLSDDATLVVDSAELQAFFGLRGRRVFTSIALLANTTTASTPAFVAPIPVAAWLEPLLPPRLAGPLLLSAPLAGVPS